jgi:hypothetical protein
MSPATPSSIFSSMTVVAAAVALLPACTEGGDAMIVTVKVRPAVVGATSLTVELKNGAGLAGDSFELRDREFPVTFSISSPGRRGDLEIQVSAKNADGLLVGRGTATIAIEGATGEVLVDSADFVVNTDFADDQYLTDDFEAVGAQLGANPSGEWTASFRQRCTPAACNVFARRFDRHGQPLTSGNAATNAFPVNTGRVGVVSSSAAAAGVDKTLLFWETTDTSNAPNGVACRAFDRAGEAPDEKAIATESSTDVVVATPLPNGTFAVAWSGRPTATTDTLNLRTIVVDGACTPLGLQQPVGTLLPAVGLRQSAIAASGPSSYLIAWRADGAIRARTFGLNGLAASSETTLLTPPAGEEFSMVRVAANNNGYALVAARRAGTKVSLELYRVSTSATADPALVGPSTLITDKLDSIFEGFSVASHPLGPILVTWHGCGTERGDGEGCGVFGRLIATNGTPFGEAFLIPTTTELDQTDASAIPLLGDDGASLFVVAWNDASTSPPDMGGLAVRARILYPQVP